MSAHIPTITRSVRVVAFLLLMTTAKSSADDFVWLNPFGGNWDIGSNWSPLGSPGLAPGDTATISLAGTYTVTLNINPANALSAFTLNSAGVTFAANNRTFNVTGLSSIQAGTVTWTNSTWNSGTLAIGANATFLCDNSTLNAGTLAIGTNGVLITRRTSTITATTLTNLGLLRIEGNGTLGFATLTITNGFTNQGTITLTNDGGSFSSQLTITSGALTNAAGGNLNLAFNGGTSLSRNFNADLVNHGTVTVDPGISAFLSKTNGVFTNHGTFTASGTGSLVTFGTDATFNQNGGTLATTTSPGAISVQMASDTFNFNGGNITGNGVLLDFCALNIGPGSVGSGHFIVEGFSTLTGDVAAAQTITLRSTGTAMKLTAATGFTNSGTINLTDGVSGTPNLIVTTGTLINAVGANINIQNGALNTTRVIDADLTNNGSFAVSNGLAFSFIKPINTITNAGNFTINSGASVSFTGDTTFNHNDGTLANNGLFNLTNDTFNFNGGIITGNPIRFGGTGGNVLNINTTNAGAFLFINNGTLSGNVSSAQTLTIQAGGVNTELTAATGFTNSGTINLITTTGSTPTLAVTTGTLTNAAGANINLQIGGSGTSRVIDADLTNNGNITLDDGLTLSFFKAINTITNAGNFSIGSGASVTFTGNATFNQNSGTLANNGLFNLTSDTFNFNGGSLTGNPIRFGGTGGNVLNINTANAGAFLFLSNSTLSGNVSSSQTITIQAGGFNTELTAATGFTNSGTINLITTTGSTPTLAVTTGTLTNAAGANINLQIGGSGTSRVIDADLTNNGNITLDDGLTLSFFKAINTITNAGNFSIGSGASVTFTGNATFNQNSGSLANNGTFSLSGDTFNFNGGSLTGNPIRFGGTGGNVLNINTTNAGAFLFLSNGTLIGNVANAQTITIQAGGVATTLTSATAFTNSGTINLITTSGTTPTLAVTTGTLTNAAGANINLQVGGSGTSRVIDADLTNNGNITLDDGLTLSFTKTTNTITNAGNFAIGSGASVTFTGNATFNQNSGSLANNGTFSLSGDTFNFNGGSLTGNPIRFGGTGGNVLNINTTNAGAFLFLSNGTLIGNVANAQTITIQASLATTLTSATAFTNSGTINLITTGSGTPTLAVTTGTLTNAAGGNINLLSGGSSGTRTLNANVANAGTIFVTANNARIDRASGTHTNSGTIFVDTGAKLSVLGATSSFTNQPTGILAGTGEIDMSSSGLTFVNNGITAPGASAGILTFRGSYNQSTTGEMRIELGGTTPGTQHDQLAVIGTASIDGTLTVTYIGGFTPGPGDTFTILTSTGARTGTFSVITPGDFFFDIAYNTNSIVLTNFVPVPEPSFIVLALGLLIRRSFKKSEAH